MKKSCLAFIVLFAASSAAWAQGAVGPNGATSVAEHIVRNANNCAPDRAEPVWGANSALAGYTCVTPSANGS
jgi:hypothetical protein